MQYAMAMLGLCMGCAGADAVLGTAAAGQSTDTPPELARDAGAPLDGGVVPEAAAGPAANSMVSVLAPAARTYPTRPVLGTSGRYALLASERITNRGASTIIGEVGLHPGTSLLGFDPSVTTHLADPDAQQALADAQSAYAELANAACDYDMSGRDLTDVILPQGVYCFSGSTRWHGTLTLDARGNDSALFIFQIAGDFSTSDDANVQLRNCGREDGVFLQVGGSVTVGDGTTLPATVLAREGAMLRRGANVTGRVVALDGALDMDTSYVSTRRSSRHAQ